MTEQLAGQTAEGAVPFVMELYARKARLQLTGERELMSSGMTGVIRVVFTFSEDWKGLKKTAVFSNGAVSIDVPEEDWVENGCTVPQQVLTTAGKNLMVGLFGTDGEEVTLPTVWCSLGRVEPGAALSGLDAVPPEAPIWARLQKWLAQLEGMTLRLVRVVDTMPDADGNLIVSLDHSFDQIETASREGQPVAMEVFGTLLLLTRLNTGASAEFSGTAFLSEGVSHHFYCLVPQRGAAILTALPVASRGEPGEAGKSAYQYALEGGYTGSEEEFYAKLAKDSVDGTPPDWNAAEGEPGYIQNRTHYSRTEQVTLLPEASLPFLEEVGGFMVTDTLSVVTGWQYTVNWNGVPYTCTCAELEDGDVVVQVLGNAAALGGDNTGEPFLLAVASTEQAADAGFYAIALPLDGAASVTLCISGPKEIITPLPAKYLPKLRGQQHFVIDLDAEKTGIPFAEAAAMDLAELQAAATVIYEGKSYSVSAIKAITEVVLGNAYEMFEISCTGREAGVRFVWSELGSFSSVQKTVLVPSANYHGHILLSDGAGKVAWLNPASVHFDVISFDRGDQFPLTYLTVNQEGQIELLDTNNVKFATFSPDGAAGAAQDEVPSYVAEEAEAVIDRVLAAQGENTFTFAAISDLHYGEGSYTEGIRHACQAIRYIDSRVKLDAVAVLGDYTDGYPSTGMDNALGDFKAVNGVLNELRFAPNLRQQGNHDYYAEDIPMTRRMIQFYSNDVVWGSRSGGYYYRDFSDHKLRVICPNTNENNPMDTSTNKPSSSISMTATQLQWLIEVLDLSSREDAEDWQILILTHHPLDYWESNSEYSLAYIVHAYQTGGSWSGNGVSCNFAGKNKAALIGNVHGHIHNLLMDRMFLGNSNSATKTAVYRMSTPNACLGRENQYTGSWGESTAYTKTRDSGKDTSFVVYCIDLSAHKITAVCYGAGYDRTLNYLDQTVLETYAVINNLTNVTSSNTSAMATGGQGYTATLTPTGSTIDSVTVVMGGVDVTASVYANGVISIPAVTGAIIITAIGSAPASWTNQIPISIASDGTPYNGGQGWKDNTRLNSSGTEASATGVGVTGFIPVKKEDIVYLKNVAASLTATGSLNEYTYLTLYDASFTSKGSKKFNTTGSALSSHEYIYDSFTTDPATGYVTSFRITDEYNNIVGSGGYLRISAAGLNGDAIITVNEPIE